jgi:class 3 adenylate cyclase/FixJ family two-component response regulator
MLGTKSKILVVDDYPALVTLTRHKLIHKGFDVITAPNGEEALSLVRSEYPDLVISDVEMPLMDGYELCSKIKNDSRLHQIPVILVTSMVTTDSLMKGISAGADNYLTKPYDDETLFSKIDELLNNPVKPFTDREMINVAIDNKNYNIKADYTHLVNLLVSTYKNTLAQNRELENIKQQLRSINQELELSKNEHEDLLQNVFPKKIADSLLAYGTVTPERYEDVTIMFTDFDGFSKVVPDLSPEKLINSLTHYFDQFDNYAEEHNLIKIKTIGDSYMAVGGLPDRNETHPIDVVLAALKMKYFMDNAKHSLNSSIPHFPLRIGIHTGPSVVGVIGKKRFAYDIWGSAVNLASRMEQNADTNYINISEATYERVKEFFECETRGEIEAKNMGKVPMYYLKRIKEEYSEDVDGVFPNRLFVRQYNMMTRTSNSQVGS